MPRLLETYEEARLLLEAKGWGVAKAAEHLSEMGFRISQAKLSKKTVPGSAFPVEPEVAAAVAGLETRVGYERKTEIVSPHPDREPESRGPSGRGVGQLQGGGISHDDLIAVRLDAGANIAHVQRTTLRTPELA